MGRGSILLDNTDIIREFAVSEYMSLVPGFGVTPASLSGHRIELRVEAFHQIRTYSVGLCRGIVKQREDQLISLASAETQGQVYRDLIRYYILEFPVLDSRAAGVSLTPAKWEVKKLPEDCTLITPASLK